MGLAVIPCAFTLERLSYIFVQLDEGVEAKAKAKAGVKLSGLWTKN